MPEINRTIIRANPFIAQAYDAGGMFDSLKSAAVKIGQGIEEKAQAGIDSQKGVDEMVKDSTITNRGLTDAKAKEIQAAISAKVSGIAKVKKNGKTVMRGKENMNSIKNRKWLAEQQQQLSHIIENGRLINDEFQIAYDESNSLGDAYDTHKYRADIRAAMAKDHLNYDPETTKKIRRENYSLAKANAIAAESLATSTVTNKKFDGTFYEFYEQEFNPMLMENKDGNISPKLSDDYFKELMSNEDYAWATNKETDKRVSEITARLIAAGGEYDLKELTFDETSMSAIGTDKADYEFMAMTDNDRNKVTVEEGFVQHRINQQKLLRAGQIRKNTVSVSREKQDRIVAGQKQRAQWILEGDPKALQWVAKGDKVDKMEYAKVGDPRGKGVIVTMSAGKWGYPKAYEEFVPIHGDDIDSGKSTMAAIRGLAEMREETFTKEELAADQATTDANNGIYNPSAGEEVSAIDKLMELEKNKK